MTNRIHRSFSDDKWISDWAIMNPDCDNLATTSSRNPDPAHDGPILDPFKDEDQNWFEKGTDLARHGATSDMIQERMRCMGDDGRGAFGEMLERGWSCYVADCNTLDRHKRTHRRPAPAPDYLTGRDRRDQLSVESLDLATKSPGRTRPTRRPKLDNIPWGVFAVVEDWREGAAEASGVADEMGEMTPATLKLQSLVECDGESGTVTFRFAIPGGSLQWQERHFRDEFTRHLPPGSSVVEWQVKKSEKSG
jgi:hypothetical protein